MKVTVLNWEGYSPALDEHYYTLVAENGVVERETADFYIHPGTILDLPDDEWSTDSEWFTLQCDRCGHIYEKKTVRGQEVSCPVCDNKEILP